ncbi:TPA: transketolase [Candidatus Woesearchaeota archaeon]|nr:transketolase [Candidatus Woesearchaeota archaeon]HII68411.1 transketolase [Candidatus Woesearchaeota archaeon]
MELKALTLQANTIRQDIIRMLTEAGSGHPGGSLGMADIFTVLYFDFLSINPPKPDAIDRDYLVLSNGHICPVLYATLAHRGFFPVKKLVTLRKLGSPLQGHPHREALPGLESSSGPLGSGLSQACGMAKGLLIDGRKNRVVCLTSDGEHQEGNTWEAVLFAAKYRLSNLIEIIDRNNIQIDGRTEEVMPLGSIRDKYHAFGWHTIEIDGNDINDIKKALAEADAVADKPSVIVAHVVPGKGVSFMENQYQWHGKAPSKEEAAQALLELAKAREGFS